MPDMRISLLTPNLSSNSLGRAWLLARILKRRYEVEIIGPSFGRDIWKPLEGDNLTYKIAAEASTLKITKRILKLITGDVLYASKPLFMSFGVGLIKKKSSDIPLVLDIDDWELGFSRNKVKFNDPIGTLRYLTNSCAHPLSNNSIVSIALLEAFTPKADQITVSGTFLRRKFGGTLVWHARDTDFLNPEKYDGAEIRKVFGIPKDKKIVIFIGTMREHKGIEDLLSALAIIRKRDVMLVLVGLGEGTYREGLEKICKTNLSGGYKFFGLQPFSKLPEFLAMSDVVVIPQRRNPATVGQVPAKVFDAMAMAKPIVATRVSDLPEILNKCGWVVEPGHPESIAHAIEEIIDNPSEASRRGESARNRCKSQYSWDAVEKILAGIFFGYEK